VANSDTLANTVRHTDDESAKNGAWHGEEAWRYEIPVPIRPACGPSAVHRQSIDHGEQKAYSELNDSGRS
jgi:hypothetical protein